MFDLANDITYPFGRIVTKQDVDMILVRFHGCDDPIVIVGYIKYDPLEYF